jgi:hypothetical protein
VGGGAGRLLAPASPVAGAPAAGDEDGAQQQRRGGPAATALLRRARDQPLTPLRATPSMTNRCEIANRTSTGMLAITPPAMIVE